jgi:hypothetical protein
MSSGCEDRQTPAPLNSDQEELQTYPGKELEARPVRKSWLLLMALAMFASLAVVPGILRETTDASAQSKPAGGVVINELLYNAPDDLDDVQWIELYNPSDQPADLGG